MVLFNFLKHTYIQHYVSMCVCVYIYTVYIYIYSYFKKLYKYFFKNLYFLNN